MIQNKHESYWSAKRAGVTAFGLLLGALIFGGFAGPSASGAPSKDKEFTQVYQHTYDEVFQASQEAIERMGMYVTAKDKDKGTIAGNGQINAAKVSFEIHIAALNTNPETRVTINTTAKGGGFGGFCPGCKSDDMKQFKERFSTELQKVLSTYH